MNETLLIYKRLFPLIRGKISMGMNSEACILDAWLLFLWYRFPLTLIKQQDHLIIFQLDYDIISIELLISQLKEKHVVILLDTPIGDFYLKGRYLINPGHKSLANKEPQ